eukprot:8853299-Ditylum_brightwellii.AAC.1
MANEQQASVTHKTIQNTRSIGKTRTPSVNKKLSQTVEDLAGHQQGFPKGVVELSEEKSSQKPPADATALTLADGGSKDKTKWTTVNNMGKSAMEIDEAHQQSKKKTKSSPKRRDRGNINNINIPTLEHRK